MHMILILPDVLPLSKPDTGYPGLFIHKIVWNKKYCTVYQFRIIKENYMFY